MARYADVEIQRALANLGLYGGEIDGKAGRLTIRGIKAFQIMHGLTPDGIVGKQTGEEMFLAGFMAKDRDEDVAPGVPVWPHMGSLDLFYGRPGTTSNLVNVEPPYQMFLAWDREVKLTTIRVHEKVADSLLAVLKQVNSRYSDEDIAKHGFNMFGGSYNNRNMRGGTRKSTHAWGVALDFDPARNRLKWGRDRAYLAKMDCNQWWDAWEEQGWVSMGRSRDYDWMHVQAARL
jgi:hypothetical protein